MQLRVVLNLCGYDGRNYVVRRVEPASLEIPFYVPFFQCSKNNPPPIEFRSRHLKQRAWEILLQIVRVHRTWGILFLCRSEAVRSAMEFRFLVVGIQLGGRRWITAGIEVFHGLQGFTVNMVVR